MSPNVLTGKLRGSELFCISQGSQNLGNGWSKCHWCGSACMNEFVHDDPPPIPFVRSKSTALYPAESYICYGCLLWRRPKVTVSFLSGDYQDGQTAKNHSWWITEQHAWALRDKRDYEEVFRQLIKPPRRFILSLRKAEERVDNLLQLTVANDNSGILAETSLYFTLNNIPHTFSIYELTESIKIGPGPYGSGVRALWNFLGEPPEELKRKYSVPKDEPRKQGEKIHKDDPKKTIKKVVVASGSQDQ